MNIFEGVQIELSEITGLPAERISLDSILNSFGADSLESYELIMNLEVRFQMEIDDERACHWRTVADIVNYIDDEIGTGMSFKEAQKEGRRYLGDMIADAADKAGIAALVKKFAPNCNCSGRRHMMNNFHRRLMGEDL